MLLLWKSLLLFSVDLLDVEFSSESLNIFQWDRLTCIGIQYFFRSVDGEFFAKTPIQEHFVKLVSLIYFLLSAELRHSV